MEIMVRLTRVLRQKACSIRLIEISPAMPLCNSFAFIDRDANLIDSASVLLFRHRKQKIMATAKSIADGYRQVLSSSSVIETLVVSGTISGCSLPISPNGYHERIIGMNIISFMNR